MHIELHWYHWVLATLAAVGVLLPLVFWKGRRLGYCAAVGGVGAVLVLAFWVADRNAQTQVAVHVPRWSGDDLFGGANSPLEFISRSSGGFCYFCFRDVLWSYGPKEWGGYRSAPDGVAYFDSGRTRVPFLGLLGMSRIESRQHSGWVRVDRHGFFVEFGSVWGIPKAYGPIRFDLVVVTPAWFLAILLSVPGLLWLYRRYFGVRKRRLRRGLCANCGYSRQGIPVDSRCPECGACVGEAVGGGGGSAGRADG